MLSVVCQSSWATAFRRAQHFIVALVLASLVAACGGGGGDDSTSSISIKLDRTSLSFTYLEGAFPNQETVVGTLVGELKGPLYMLATDEGTALNPQIGTSFSTTSASFFIRPKEGLAPGSYSGRLKVLACSDQLCNSPVAGTPLYVAYTIVVQPVFRATPGSVDLISSAGQPAVGAVQIQLPAGAAGFSVAPSSIPTWLEAEAIGTELRIRSKPWRSGSYNAMLELVAGNDRVVVQVNLQVFAPQGGDRDLSVAPQSLTLSAFENVLSTSQDIVIGRPSWAPDTEIPWRIEYEGATQGWLLATKTANGLSLVGDARVLRQGSYRAALVFEPSAPASPSRVPVAFTVGAGMVSPAAVVTSATAKTSIADLSGSWTIQAAGGSAFTWRAQSSDGWLLLSRSSGSIGDTLNWTIDPAAFARLTNFVSHTAAVTLQPDAAHISPVSVNVTISKRLPEVHSTSPQVLLKTLGGTLVIAGRGFNELLDPATSLQISGLQTTTVTRVNDSMLRVTVAAPPSEGAVPVTISNALGELTERGSVRIVSPQTYAYAAIPSGGNPRSILVDPARNAVWGVNVKAETLQRFSYNGSTWSVSAKPVPNILDAGLAADGNSILVTSTPGRLTMIDAESLATTFTLDEPRQFYRGSLYASFGIPRTADGRSWLTIGSTWNEFGWFDVRTRTIKPRDSQPGFTTSFYGGPEAVSSWDGSRMLVVQSGLISPTPPMLEYNPSSGLLSVDPSGQTYVDDMHLSADGSKAILYGSQVRDRTGALIGRATLPDTRNYYSRTGLMSPDGRRAYVLARPLMIGLKSRVYVYDTQAINPVSTDLPLVGSIELQDEPTCLTDDYHCNTRARSAISPDGGTLFYLGDRYLVIQPIDPALRSINASVTRRTLQAPQPKRWK